MEDHKAPAAAASLREQYGHVADAIEAYVEEHFWDPAGLLYSYLDMRTGRPFDREFITPVKVPRRADTDPWAWWTYEDTVLSTGLYLDGLMRKHAVTGDASCLTRAERAWRSMRNTYYASQANGIGSFLRPYGGFETMLRFAEPLGTDQASPLFTGAYLLRKHLDGHAASEMDDILLRSLGWYEQQGFRYFYYRNFIHEWEPAFQHAASYYLPAIAWAAQATGEEKWQRHLESGFGRFGSADYDLFTSLNWGGDLAVLAELLGERRGEYVTREMLDRGYHLCRQALEAYREPGMLQRIHPESSQPGFRPYVRADFDRERGFGFAFFATVHGGRMWPRREAHFLCGLAQWGHPDAYEEAVRLLLIRQRVPEDFSEFASEDYGALPEEAHLYARSAGVPLFEWWRNYWWLRSLAPAQVLPD